MPTPSELQKAWDNAEAFVGEKNDPEAALNALRSARDDNLSSGTIGLGQAGLRILR